MANRIPLPANLNDLVPAAPGGSINVKFQADSNSPRNVSAYVPAGTGTGGVDIQTGTSYTLRQQDQGAVVVLTASGCMVTADSTLPSGFSTSVLFASGGTVTPSSGLINDQAYLSFAPWGGALLAFDGTNWWADFIGTGGGGGGSGSVTSVGLSMPAEFSVAGSPVTSSGTISVTKANESANTVYAGPSSGGSAPPNFRALVQGDLPSQPYDVVFTPNIVLGSGAVYRIIVFTRSVTFPGNFSGSQGHCSVNPGSTQTITVNKNGSSIGTISISSAGVFTFATTGGSPVSFAAGDHLSVTNQAGADTNMLMFFTLAGTR